MLQVFLRNQGRVMTRTQVIDEVWGHDVFVTDRVVDTHVVKLRRKIEADPARAAPHRQRARHRVSVRTMKTTPKHHDLRRRRLTVGSLDCRMEVSDMRRTVTALVLRACCWRAALSRSRRGQQDDRFAGGDPNRDRGRRSERRHQTVRRHRVEVQGRSRRDGDGARPHGRVLSEDGRRARRARSTNRWSANSVTNGTQWNKRERGSVSRARLAPAWSRDSSGRQPFTAR